MRNLAILGCIGIFVSATSAQSQKNTEFASGKQPKITVDSLPAPAPVAPPPVVKREYCPEQLLRMEECQLIDVYKCGSVTPVPCGKTPGIVIYNPGSMITVPLSNLMKYTGSWQGKFITSDTMYNRQFCMPTMKGKIGTAESWIDGKPTTVFDYEGESLICHRYRDEVREVSPGVYLGAMHRRNKDSVCIATWFVLDARCDKGGCPQLRRR
jgi:hypothetical protein